MSAGRISGFIVGCAIAWGTVIAFLVFGKLWLGELGSPLKSAILFLWLLVVIFWCAFGVVAQADHLAELLGEPLGTLVLTLTIVIIEVALISALMPPKGAVIPSVPDSSTTVYGAVKSFVYANGVFYEQVGHGYKIVEPPLGVLVPSIPEGATVVTVNDAKYFEFGGVWYRPFYSGSDVVYQTVANPSP